MAERPILFSGPMVRAILEGRKTQTRRIIKPQPVNKPFPGDLADTLFWHRPGGPVRFSPNTAAAGVFSPYGDRGDRLWVRETFARSSDLVRGHVYAADPHISRFDIDGEHWTPSIHMPRRASRIDLEIVGVRVERLQDITEADIIAEGVTVPLASQMTGIPWSDLPTLHHAWAAGWNHINGDRATWESNPWIWRVEFKLVQP